MSRLATALAQQPRIRKGPICSIAATIRGLDKADAADLTAALANPAVASTSLSRALRSIDVDLSSHAIGRHRRGDCDCGR